MLYFEKIGGRFYLRQYLTKPALSWVRRPSYDELVARALAPPALAGQDVTLFTPRGVETITLPSASGVPGTAPASPATGRKWADGPDYRPVLERLLDDVRYELQRSPADTGLLAEKAEVEERLRELEIYA